MDVSCNIKIKFDSPDDVKTVLKSIQVDDLGFVKSKINGNELEAEIKSKSVSSLLHTLDDYLACVSVASKIVNK